MNVRKWMYANPDANASELEGKDFADEVMRIYTKGRIIPQLWMQHAVGNSIAIGPTLEASGKALKAIK